MSDVIVISAIAKNFVIGKDGDIPWRIKEDFKHFKDITTGYPCVMGDVTYESLPDNTKPLPGRENIICTFDKNYKPKGVTIFFSFEEAIDYAKKKYDKVFICGGASIYKLGLKIADKLELTIIDKDFEGDTFFPEINFDEWKLINKEDHVDETHGKYSFCTYKRKKI